MNQPVLYIRRVDMLGLRDGTFNAAFEDDGIQESRKTNSLQVSSTGQLHWKSLTMLGRPLWAFRFWISLPVQLLHDAIWGETEHERQLWNLAGRIGTISKQIDEEKKLSCAMLASKSQVCWWLVTPSPDPFLIGVEADQGKMGDDGLEALCEKRGHDFVAFFVFFHIDFNTWFSPWGIEGSEKNTKHIFVMKHDLQAHNALQVPCIPFLFWDACQLYQLLRAPMCLNLHVCQEDPWRTVQDIIVRTSLFLMYFGLELPQLWWANTPDDHLTAKTMPAMWNLRNYDNEALIWSHVAVMWCGCICSLPKQRWSQKRGTYGLPTPLMVVNSWLCWFGIGGWLWTESTKMTIILHVSNADVPCHGMRGLWKIFSDTKQMELLFCCWFLWKHSFSRLEKSIWALWRSNWIPLKMMCPGQKMWRQTGHVFEPWRLHHFFRV